MRKTFKDITNIMAKKAFCETPGCSQPATHLCGETAVSELLCSDHVSKHAGCADCYDLQTIKVTVQTGVLRSMYPDDQFIINSLLNYARKTWSVTAVESGTSHDSSLWKIHLMDVADESITMKSTLGKLRETAIPMTRKTWEMFCAVADSYVLEQTATTLSLYDLFHTVDSRRDMQHEFAARMADITIDELLGQPMDAILHHMMTTKQKFQWLTNMDTLWSNSRAPSHTATRQAEGLEAGGVDGAAAAPDQRQRDYRAPPAHDHSGAAGSSPRVGLVPLSVGRRELRSFSWDNPMHAAARNERWANGPGIGVPQLFAGLPGKMGIFAFHEESLGGDFVNILSEDSKPVVWMFITKNFRNNSALMALYTATHPTDQLAWYKGTMLSTKSLLAAGVQGVQQIIQQPGTAICGHQYHQGIGGEKLAEAHSWFGEEWHLLPTWQEGFPPRQDTHEVETGGSMKRSAASDSESAGKRRAAMGGMGSGGMRSTSAEHRAPAGMGGNT